MSVDVSTAIAVSAGVLVVVFFKFLFDQTVRPQWLLRHVPGPDAGGLLAGNIQEVFRSPPSEAHRKWHQAYGPVIRYNGFLRGIRVSIQDPRALHHLLVTESYNFPKPVLVQRMLATALGEGVLIAEGETHRRQRKIMNPSFGPAHIKTLYPIFLEKAHALRDKILSTVEGTEGRPVQVDIYELANRTTLDVISSAGFGYEVHAIENGDANELARAFKSLFAAITEIRIIEFVFATFPILRKLFANWTLQGAIVSNAVATMSRVGHELVEEKKREAITAARASSAAQKEKTGALNVDSNQLSGKKDLLSLFVKANMATDLKPSQKLTDKEVAAQISTFLLAGNDTTANGITWAIFGLCKYPQTQQRLRSEISEALNEGGPSPTFEQLNALPYLDGVIRETLRVYAPVMGTSRDVKYDSVLPLSKPFVDKNGQAHHEIFLPKHATVFVPIGHMQTDTEIWGPDALDFKPERWLPENSASLPAGATEMPSVAFPTFLAGPRACIGFRFTLAEMKAVLFDLIGSMKFDLAVPVDDVEARNRSPAKWIEVGLFPYPSRPLKSHRRPKENRSEGDEKIALYDVGSEQNAPRPEEEPTSVRHEVLVSLGLLVSLLLWRPELDLVFGNLSRLGNLGLERHVLSSSSSFDYSYNVSSCPGYKIHSAHYEVSKFTASLRLAGAPCNAFGKDYEELTLSVEYETASRLRVHIYDKDGQQFQIPSSVLDVRPEAPIPGEASDLEFKYEDNPFAFWIVRRRNGDIIFDTRSRHIPTYHDSLDEAEQDFTNSTAMPSHPLVFSDQYLQISSTLPHDANIYGLGEYYSGNYRRNASGTVQPFWALDIGDPVDANMYGYHAVYQEVRPRKSSQDGHDGSNVDSHAVWLKTSAGMDVLLRDGVVQYRAIGGTFDFYFYSGDVNGRIPGRPQSPGWVNSATHVIEQYVQHVGLPQVPPRWAFGYHQSRWGYANLSQLNEIVDSMREADIPLETMWSDIDWMHEYRNFESDPVRYNKDDFLAFISRLHGNHQHYIPIIDAAISVQVPNGTDRYDTAARGVDLGTFIMNPDPHSLSSVEEYVGVVWPGFTYFPDWWATNTAKWWTEAFTNMSHFMPFDGIWLDMNEPSSFCVGSCGTDADWGKPPPSVTPTEIHGWPEGYDHKTFGDSGNITVNGSFTYNPKLEDDEGSHGFSFALTEDDAEIAMPSNTTEVRDHARGRSLSSPPYTIHNAHGPIDKSTVAANASTALGLMYDVKNLWGYAEERLTHATLLQIHPRKRPFLVSRSTFSGSGKYTAHWLGDNDSTWRSLYLSLQGVFQFQLFGIPMVGADTCGFARNTDEELCNRWMALSAFHPFFRNHNVLLAISQEPYRWDSVAEVSRKVLAARYRLLPLWETLFARASERGTPVIRTIWQEFPGRGYEAADRQFLIGDSLLVTPVLVPNVTSVSGVFPDAGGPWRDLWTHKVLGVQPGVNTSIPAPLSHINVHIRPGTILATYAAPRYTTYETAQSGYRLIVSLDDSGQATGEVYHDDGETQWTGPGRAPGSTRIFQVIGHQLMSGSIGEVSELSPEVEEVVILGLKRPNRVELGGRSVSFTYETETQALVVQKSPLMSDLGVGLRWD